jgi:hypothetical protein
LEVAILGVDLLKLDDLGFLCVGAASFCSGLGGWFLAKVFFNRLLS